MTSFFLLAHLERPPLGRPLAALVAAAALFVAAPAHADDALPAHLEVARTHDASACPGAPQLADAVSRAVGRDALTVASSAASEPRFDVVFAHVATGYLATLRRDGARPAARTLAGTSCAELTEAVVVALALMLDDAEVQATPAPPSPPPARFEPAEIPPPAPPPEPPPRHWYGWQTLIVDGASASFVIVGGSMSGSSAQGGVVGVGLTGYALATPIVHFAHGRVGIGFASLGIRVGSTVTLGLIGGLLGGATAGYRTYGASCPTATSCTGGPSGAPSPDPGTVGAVVGASIGAAIATTLDATVFAREVVRPRPAVDYTTGAVSWSPSFSPSSRGASAGVVGRF